MVNSKSKGNRGEREFAQLLREYGYTEARRGQQFNGIEGEDVVGVEDVHIEVKRVENLNLYKAWAQSVRDAESKMPIVAHRKNRTEWLVTMRATDWIRLKRIYDKWNKRNAD